MRIEITKGAREDRIAIRRPDGSGAETTFPKKGTVPHDAVHWWVERELGLRQGFWGMVAGGRHPEEIADIAKAAGHASAKRAEVPDASIIELLQAERLVECFEADMWSPGGNPSDLVALGETACAYSHVAAPDTLDVAAAGRIRAGLAAFAGEWTTAPHGHIAVFDWE